MLDRSRVGAHSGHTIIDQIAYLIATPPATSLEFHARQDEVYDYDCLGVKNEWELEGSRSEERMGGAHTLPEGFAATGLENVADVRLEGRGRAPMVPWRFGIPSHLREAVGTRFDDKEQRV